MTSGEMMQSSEGKAAYQRKRGKGSPRDGKGLMYWAKEFKLDPEDTESYCGILKGTW